MSYSFSYYTDLRPYYTDFLCVSLLATRMKWISSDSQIKKNLLWLLSTNICSVLIKALQLFLAVVTTLYCLTAQGHWCSSGSNQSERTWCPAARPASWGSVLPTGSREASSEWRCWGRPCCWGWRAALLASACGAESVCGRKHTDLLLHAVLATRNVDVKFECVFFHYRTVSGHATGSKYQCKNRGRQKLELISLSKRET